MGRVTLVLGAGASRGVRMPTRVAHHRLSTVISLIYYSAWNPPTGMNLL